MNKVNSFISESDTSEFSQKDFIIQQEKSQVEISEAETDLKNRTILDNIS